MPTSIPFYPECDTAFVDDVDVTDAPIRIFHGVADDYVSLARCRSYVERLRKAGKNVELTEYAGRYYVFDGAQFKAPLTLPEAQTTRNCQLEEIANGIVVNSQTNAVHLYRSLRGARGYRRVPGGGAQSIGAGRQGDTKRQFEAELSALMGRAAA